MVFPPLHPPWSTSVSALTSIVCLLKVDDILRSVYEAAEEGQPGLLPKAIDVQWEQS